MDKVALFAEETNRQHLASFLRNAGAMHPADARARERLEISLKIVRYIYNDPNAWDDRCPFNIKHIGEKYVTELGAFDSDKPETINRIYAQSFRFLCEFDFFVGEGRELSHELQSLKEKVLTSDHSDDEHLKMHIAYIAYTMPANIAKEFLNRKEISLFADFDNRVEEIKKLRGAWDEEIEKRSKRVDALKRVLEKYETAFNFVGLYQGFESLAKEKRQSARATFWSLILMAIVVLAPLTWALATFPILTASSIEFSAKQLLVLIPLVSLEIVLVYFFRILLIHHKSLKAQLMQIELRQTLCQFIQNYVAYSSEIRKTDAGTLDKFENLIFSGIVADPGDVPSTYDGLEQLSSFVKSLRPD